jgi:hypothetical protein
MAVSYGDLISCAIDPVGDTDVFSFLGSPGESVSILVSRRGGGTPCVELFDSQGKAVGQGIVCFTPLIRPQLTLNGTYTIRVSELGNDQLLDYVLSLERVSPPSSTVKPIGLAQTLNDEINPSGDVDLFFFNGQAFSTVSIVVARRGGGTPCVTLFDPRGNIVGQGTVCITTTIGAQLTLSGNYTILVTELGNDTLDYAVNVQCLGGCPPLLRPVSFFPLVPDGSLPDGSYFNSTLLVYNQESPSSCQVDFRAIATPPLTLRDGSLRSGPPVSVNLNTFGWEVLRTSGVSGPITTGYVELSCTNTVDSQMLYTLYNSSGVKLSEAAVFGQPFTGSRIAQVIIDQRNGQRLGIAITNSMEHTANLRLLVSNSDGATIRDLAFTVAPKSLISRFIDELVSELPANFVGKAVIRANDTNGTDEFHAVALSFTGAIFTTIPVATCRSLSGSALPECREIR